MGSAFAGTLLLPGEDGPGLDAVLETVEDEFMLTAGIEHLGSWSQTDYRSMMFDQLTTLSQIGWTARRPSPVASDGFDVCATSAGERHR
jgi:hypothetical protein